MVFERAMREDQGVMASERFEFVRRRDERQRGVAAIFAATASAKPRLELSPVPTAVPPWASR